MTENTVLTEKNRDKLGKFVRGNKANPTGANGFTSINNLLVALKQAGIKRKEDFWKMVAARAWTSETVLIAILKKILPDKVKGEGFANTNTVINILKTYASSNGSATGNKDNKPEALPKTDSRI